MSNSTPTENPIDKFIAWYKEAEKCPSIDIPEAMSLSTFDGVYPDSRIVLLKQVDEKGFIFYTNYNSPKSLALEKYPKASILFYWEKLKRQVRIRGTVEKTESTFIDPLLNTFLTAEQNISKFLLGKKNSTFNSDAYFETRSRKAQIGAWASDQSKKIKNREELEEKIIKEEKRFKDKQVPRPPHWGGYRLIPDEIEFWTDGRFRLHDRFLYIKTDNSNWDKTRLSP